MAPGSGSGRTDSDEAICEFWKGVYEPLLIAEYYRQLWERPVCKHEIKFKVFPWKNLWECSNCGQQFTGAFRKRARVGRSLGRSLIENFYASKKGPCRGEKE